MITIKEHNRVVHYFPELADFLECVHPDKASKVRGVFQREVNQWDGGLTYTQSYDLCATGQAADVEMIELRDALTTDIRLAKSQSSYWDVAGGGAIDVGAHLQGIPECMLEFNEEVGKARRTISLLVSVDANSAASAEQMRLRGAANMALIDALESSGLYKINIYGTWATRSSPQSWHGIIRIKEAGHHYDPNAIAFVMSNPAFLRRLVFGYQDLMLLEMSEAFRCNARHAYGRPEEVITLPNEIDYNCVDLSEPLNGMDIPFYSKEGAIKWVKSKLNKYGVGMEG